MWFQRFTSGQGHPRSLLNWWEWVPSSIRRPRLWPATTSAPVPPSPTARSKDNPSSESVLDYLRSRPPRPPGSREDALHLLFSLKGAILHFRCWGVYGAPPPRTAGEGAECPEAKKEEYLTRPPDTGAETHLQASPPGNAGGRRPEGLTDTLRTRLQTGLTSRVNVTHAGDSRVAEASAR